MNIVADPSVLGDCTGQIHTTRSHIIQILGFEPNVEDDADKVENSWGFQVDGVRCAIWDYKGSHHDDIWSTFGPKEIFLKLFPNNYFME